MPGSPFIPQPIDFTSGLTPEQLAQRYADDEVVTRALPSVEQLSRAALAVHKVCVVNSIPHAFFGGFELVMLGRKRGTKGVDVEIARSTPGGVDKIVNAFRNSGEFRVLAGNRDDAVCTISPVSRMIFSRSWLITTIVAVH